MSTHHQTLEDRALEALSELFSDISVSMDVTMESLQVLRDQLDILTEALENDIERAMEIDCSEAAM